MATIKVIFRPSTVQGKAGTLYYRVGRMTRPLRTGYRLHPHEWDGRTQRILLPPAGERRGSLAELQERIDRDLDRLRRIVGLLERRNPNYTHEELATAFRTPDVGFFDLMRETIASLRAHGRLRTAETYYTTMRSFARFRGGLDLRPDEVTAEVTASYEAWLRESGVCKNTSSFYMRILRAVYNRAVEKELAPQTRPFRHVYTGIDKTVKRAIALESVRRIRDMELADAPALGFARDMFLFSFYTRGMSFVDMTFLKRSDLKAGILTYRRQKTGQQLSIRWEPCMQQIVDRYPNPATEYLLPIIRTPGNEHRQYKNIGALINRGLTTIGEQIGLATPLTLYVARHTWASIARSKEIPLSVISESMGHNSEATTRIYLASLDTATVDRANRAVIDALSGIG